MNKLKQEMMMLNFEHYDSIKTLLDLGFDEEVTSFSDEIYFIMLNELEKNEKLMKLIDIPSLSERGLNGDIFEGDFYYTAMFRFDVINAYVGEEGLEDGTSDISFITHIKNWKLIGIEALMFYPDDERDEEHSYSVYPEFELPLSWMGKFKRKRI